MNRLRRAELRRGQRHHRTAKPAARQPCAEHVRRRPQRLDEKIQFRRAVLKQRLRTAVRRG